MRSVIAILFFVLAAVILSCNNETKQTTSSQESMADTLFEEVMDGHNVGMAKMQKLSAAQTKVKSFLDSIQKLPSKAKESLTPYKTRMDSLLRELEYADYAMNRWMQEFNYDSAKNDINERIKYLTNEKLKIENVKSAILNSLSKADSLLQNKF